SSDKTIEKDLNKEISDRYMALLPDQYPMSPSGIEPHLKVDRRFDRVSSKKIDPRPYLNNLFSQQKAEEKKLEGLSPNVRAAAKANLEANTQKAIGDIMLKIDNANLSSEQRTEEVNSQIQRMEENASAKDALSYEQRQLLAKAKTEAEVANYYDKIQEVNIGNFATINALNNANARYSDIQFDGTGYVVSDAPDFERSLEQLMLARMMQQQKETKK
ncbi:MAG: hypothetical protein KDH96_07285, partial [Candidatus Riesia sp.]|nr:hypothetical protein [Candidatus Riesia sp.]